MNCLLKSFKNSLRRALVVFFLMLDRFDKFKQTFDIEYKVDAPAEFRQRKPSIFNRMTAEDLQTALLLILNTYLIFEGIN